MTMADGRIYVYSAPGYDTGWTRTVEATTVKGHGKLKVGWTGRADARIRRFGSERGLGGVRA